MATNIQTATGRVVSRNPATGELLKEFLPADEAAVRATVREAKAAQIAWDALGVRKRIGIVREFQRLLVERKEEVARLITREAGKPCAEALVTEILVVLDAARFLADHAVHVLRDVTVPHGNIATKTKSGKVVRMPYGVVGIVSPWNYPFSIPATESLAALIAGNAVVLKPSEFTPLVALQLASLLHDAGVPRDVFQVVIGDGATGAALVGPEIDKLIFTGSVATGKKIAQAAAEHLLPVVLELGGKDPMLVLEDADVDVASSGAVWGAFVNAGQTCLSVERCYVHRSIYPAFLEACVQKVKRLRVANGIEAETDIGPLIHEKQVRTVESHVQDAIARGAKVLTGGHRLTALGPNFYAPTVLADVNHEMRIMREETFGPVLPIMAFDTDDEAISFANDSDFGLAASIWTNDRKRGESLALRTRTGAVMVNDVVSYYGISEAPHGGMKASGIGRTHGHFGLEEMVRSKYVDSDRLPRMKKLWWYGYGSAFMRQMNGFADFQFARGMGRRLRGAIGSLGMLTRKGKL